jgi:SAM-dependent methyltransferase
MSDRSERSLSISAQARYEFVRGLVTRDLEPPAKIVELGSAPGDQIAALARLGYEGTSVDLGEASDDWGSGEPGVFGDLLEKSGVKNVIWNLEEIPYPLPDEYFDGVLLTEVLEHLREYPARSLAEIRRILKPGGRLYLTTPNAAYVMNRLRLLAGRSVHTALDDWIGGLPHARHAREYTFSEVRRLLDHVGLEVIHAESRHFYRHYGRSGTVGRAAKLLLDGVARVRAPLGPAIIVVAKRPR